MGHLLRRFWCLLAVALCCFAASAFADTVDVNFIGAQGNSLAGVDIYPYYLSINHGPTTPAICDDYMDDISAGQQWPATINTYATLGNTWWTDGTPSTTVIADYEEATWLGLQMMNSSPSCKYSGGNCVGDISFAIWGIFDPAALNSLPAGAPDSENALWWESQAAQYGQNGTLHGFEILTPYPDVGAGKGGPQEFLVYHPSCLRTPEAPTSALFGVGILGLIAVVIAFRR